MAYFFRCIVIFHCFDRDYNRIGKMMAFQAKLTDMKNEAIVQECIKAANEAGITDLFLLDKKFIVDAIREKLEREGLMKNEHEG